MSADTASLAGAFLAGVVLGALYAATLWAAVRRLARLRQPALALVAGSVLRIGLLLGAFYLVMDGRWERLLACFAGFLVVRLAAIRWASADAAPRSGG